MKITHIWHVFVVALVLSAPVAAQTSHVHTTYSKDTKQTKVATSTLYMTNTVEEFIEVQFESLYKGEKLIKPVDKVNISVFSLARKARHRGSSDQVLYVITDGKRWTLGTMLYVGTLEGETKNGKDTFFSRNNENLGVQVTFPQSAKVRNASGEVNGLTMEWLNMDIKTDQLGKILAAQKVEFQLGSSAFELNETHFDILRDFLAHLVP